MSTTMDQIHHIRDMFYRQDKNISEMQIPVERYANSNIIGMCILI